MELVAPRPLRTVERPLRAPVALRVPWIRALAATALVQLLESVARRAVRALRRTARLVPELVVRRIRPVPVVMPTRLVAPELRYKAVAAVAPSEAGTSPLGVGSP